MILNVFSGIEFMKLYCIKSPLEKVEKEMGDIILETLNKKWQKREIDLHFGQTLSYYDDKTNVHEMVKCLIWQPQSIDFDLVIFLSSMPDGWPTLLNKYFTINKKEIIGVGLSDIKVNFPSYFFEYRNNNNHRIIQAIKDINMWNFFESGLLTSFENELNYKKRKISDRLNNDIINDYLLKNGIDISKDVFWNSKGKAVEFYTKL